MPVPASRERRQLVGKLAITKRFQPHADTTEIEREIKAKTIEDHIRALADSAPPLTREQRVRLAQLLLRGGADR